MLTLASEVQYLKGVGPARAETLASRGIFTVEDLLYYTPFRYEDRTRVTPVNDLMPGQATTIMVRVLTCGLTRTRSGVYLFDLSAADASGELDSRGLPQGNGAGSTGAGSAPITSPDPLAGLRRAGTRRRRMIRCIWFNAAYLQQKGVFKSGQLVFFYGKAQPDRYGVGNLQMVQPQFEIVQDASEADEGDPDPQAVSDRSLEIGRVVPIYQAIGAMGTRVLRRRIWSALTEVGGGISETLPPSVVQRNNFLPRSAALAQTHFPEKSDHLNKLHEFRSPAQVSMIFEELFHVGAALALRRRKMKSNAAAELKTNEKVRSTIKRILPFHPTGAQKRVLKEIVDDMCSSRPMNRLLQGDVGSGKTIVAIQAAIVAIENGFQAAIMAPTEILATQHFLYTRQLLAPLEYKVELLISARKRTEKENLKRAVAEGEVNLIVGTHALIEGDVEFSRLGLVIVDEQHRFGVLQRYELMKKANAPHVLVMTATPIPRTLALTLYGDLDVSVIDQLPPNRTPIRTRLLKERERNQAFDFIRTKVSKGEQAYIIYPLIEDSDQLDLRPAVRMYEHLSTSVFPDLRVGLLHGRLTGDEKERVMQAFKANQIQVLVATTVVEVGVDVPNATVMLIEHAEHFGLAPLHQLRGRIGRGKGESTCLLLAEEPLTDAAAERLRTFTETTDGFKIAETDLKLRGPGDFIGTRQTGIPAFRIANLLRDQQILEWAKREASDFIEHPPSREEYEAYVTGLRRAWPQRYRLAEVG
jgi:ATP-dependent DNA helicase RecG